MRTRPQARRPASPTRPWSRRRRPIRRGRRRQALDVCRPSRRPADRPRARPRRNQAAIPAPAKRIVEATLQRIERREDCSDFWLPPLLYFWCALPQRSGRVCATRPAGDPRLSLLDGRARQRRDVVLEREPRALLPRRAVSGRAGFSRTTASRTPAGPAGSRQALGRERLDRGSRTSRPTASSSGTRPPTTRSTAIGLLALHELAADAADPRRGRALPRPAVPHDRAQHARRHPSSTQGRSYDRDLKFPALTETSAFAWIEWGRGALNPMAYAAAAAVPRRLRPA